MNQMPDAGPQKRDFEAEDAVFQGMWYCSEVELPSDRRARHLHDDRVFSWRRAPTSLCVERQRSPIEIELLPDLTKRDAMSGQTYKRNLMLLDDYSVRITGEVIIWSLLTRLRGDCFSNVNFHIFSNYSILTFLKKIGWDVTWNCSLTYALGENNKRRLGK